MTKLDLNQVFSYFKSLFIQMFYFNSPKNHILLFREKKKSVPEFYISYQRVVAFEFAEL